MAATVPVVAGDKLSKSPLMAVMIEFAATPAPLTPSPTNSPLLPLVEFMRIGVPPGLTVVLLGTTNSGLSTKAPAPGVDQGHRAGAVVDDRAIDRGRAAAVLILVQGGRRVGRRAGRQLAAVDRAPVASLTNKPPVPRVSTWL